MRTDEMIFNLAEAIKLKPTFLVHYSGGESRLHWHFRDEFGRSCSPVIGFTDDQALRFCESVAACTERQWESFLSFMDPTEFAFGHIDESSVVWRPDAEIFFPDELQVLPLSPPADHERPPQGDEWFAFNSEAEKAEALAEALTVDRTSLTAVGHAIERLLGLEDGRLRKTFPVLITRGRVSLEQALVSSLGHLDRIVAQLS